MSTEALSTSIRKPVERSWWTYSSAHTHSLYLSISLSIYLSLSLSIYPLRTQNSTLVYFFIQKRFLNRSITRSSEDISGLFPASPPLPPPIPALGACPEAASRT